MSKHQSDIRKECQQVAAILERNSKATTREIAMELNISNRSALYRKASLGILPKPSRIGLVRTRVTESPCTAEEMARELNVPIKAIQDDLGRLKWMGEIVDERLWRIK
jgi:predicted ArsR family transcriptional regulator